MYISLKMSLDYMVKYLQIFNTLITIILNLSPIFVFIPVLKGRQKYSNIPFLMLVFNLLNCICWSCYWYRMTFMFPLLCNAICYVISTTFFVIYLFFFAKKVVQTFCFYIILLIIIETIIMFISLYIFNLKLYGIILIVVNVLMFIAPGQNVIRVIKERNYKLIPIATTIIAIICSGGWLLFGIYVKDINCILPNMIGLACSIVTTFIWFFFYIRAKFTINKNQLYPEENSNNNNVEIK